MKRNLLGPESRAIPTRTGRSPAQTNEVVVFENSFSSMTQDPSASEQEYHVSGNTLWPVRKVNGRCELVCFNLIRVGCQPTFLLVACALAWRPGPSGMQRF